MSNKIEVDRDLLELVERNLFYAKLAEPVQEKLRALLSSHIVEADGMVAAPDSKCPDCNGRGQHCMAGCSAHPDNWYDCDTCKGGGTVQSQAMASATIYTAPSNKINDLTDGALTDEGAMPATRRTDEVQFKGMIEARGGKFAIMIDEANAHYGWTFQRHPDGMWVSGRKATEVEMHAARTHAHITKQQ